MTTFTVINKPDVSIETGYGLTVTATVGIGTLEINVEKNANATFDTEVQVLTESGLLLLAESGSQIIGEQR